MNQNFTVSAAQGVHVLPVAGSRYTACLLVGGKIEFCAKFVKCCFPRVLESYDCLTKFNSSLGMEYNGKLYGFSAVKVKLVDSLI